MHLYEFAVVKYPSSTIPDPTIVRSLSESKDVRVTIQDEEPEDLDFSICPRMGAVPRVLIKQSGNTKISEIFEDATAMANSSVE